MWSGYNNLDFSEVMAVTQEPAGSAAPKFKCTCEVLCLYECPCRNSNPNCYGCNCVCNA